MMKRKYDSFILAKNLPSFWDGFFSVFDLFGSNYNLSEDNDFEIIQNDWNIIGEDFYQAIENYEQNRQFNNK